MKRWFILLALLCSLPCGAVNLVRNPGFEEASTLTQWTVTPAASGSLILVGATTPHSGSRNASFGAESGQDDVLSQVLTTNPGETYVFNFWMQLGSDQDIHFAASFNSTTLLNLTNTTTVDGLYQQFQFTVTGTGTDTIAFAGRSSIAFARLDDVYFGSTVPELAPACAQLPLLIASLLLTASRRRRGALAL